MNPLVAVLEQFDERPYECCTCGSSFRVQYHVCPRCEGFSVETIDDAHGSHPA